MVKPYHPRWLGQSAPALLLLGAGVLVGVWALLAPLFGPCPPESLSIDFINQGAAVSYAPGPLVLPVLAGLALFVSYWGLAKMLARPGPVVRLPPPGGALEAARPSQ